MGLNFKDLSEEDLFKIAREQHEMGETQPMLPFEKFVADSNIRDGNDEVEFKVMVYFYHQWCYNNNTKPRHYQWFSKQMAKLFKRKSYRRNSMSTYYYLIDGSDFVVDNEFYELISRWWRYERYIVECQTKQGRHASKAAAKLARKKRLAKKEAQKRKRVKVEKTPQNTQDLENISSLESNKNTST